MIVKASTKLQVRPTRLGGKKSFPDFFFLTAACWLISDQAIIEENHKKIFFNNIGLTCNFVELITATLF